MAITLSRAQVGVWGKSLRDDDGQMQCTKIGGAFDTLSQQEPAH